MIIETKHFGTLEVAEDKVITFPQGLFAFEDKKRYILLENEEPESPLWWLQSLDDPNLAFVLLNPFLFKPDYELELSAEDVEELGLEKPQEAAVFCLAVIPQDVKKMTANLLAPLVINAQLKKGKQIVLYHKNYTTKHLVLEEMQKAKQNCQGEGSHHVSTD
ncbi:MAG TPA: flagellar assembly protein FliW [Clostridia bacterium]|nr:flagellar assembly protein FliW [Clostridia bacterium]